VILMKIEKNTWVQIHKILLNPAERTANLPEDTKKVPLEMWVKGYLLSSANIGDIVIIRTRTGRIEEGTLVAVNPSYMHNFGHFAPELLKIDDIVKSAVFGSEKDA